MQVTILEPHGDDALISCWPILRKNNNEVRVITFGNSRNSAGLMNHFPSVKETRYLDLYEVGAFARASYQKYYNQWKNSTTRPEYSPSRDRSSWGWQVDITKYACQDLWIEAKMALDEVLKDELVRIPPRS